MCTGNQHQAQKQMSPSRLLHAVNLTYLNPKAKKVHQLGTFRLPGTNGLVCAHRRTGYSVRYAVVQIDRDCSHPNLLLFVMFFYNWKKALNRFKDHERSTAHREGVSKLQGRSQGVDVGAMISKQYEAEKRNNRAMLMKLLHCIRYLARQGLAFRGHHEDSVAFEGNLYQLLLLQATDSPVFHVD